MSAESKAIIEKIRKLLALSTSPNENEATAAMEKFHAMLAKYNLSRTDLEEAQEEFFCDDAFVTDNKEWRIWLAKWTAKLYFCESFFDAIDGQPYLVHSFVGAKHNLAVAKLMFAYFVGTVEHLSKEAGEKVSANERASYLASFQTACAHRICMRIKERLEAAKAGTLLLGADSRNLPALIDQTEAKLDAALSSSTELVEAGDVDRSHSGALLDGMNAGNNVGLDTQVNSQRRQAIGAGA